MAQLLAAQHRLPPTQFPLTQSFPTLHVFPLANLLPHWFVVFRQVSFTQSVSVAQVARHAVPVPLHW
jgi:hypothetical protein